MSNAIRLSLGPSTIDLTQTPSFRFSAGKDGGHILTITLGLKEVPCVDPPPQAQVENYRDVKQLDEDLGYNNLVVGLQKNDTTNIDGTATLTLSTQLVLKVPGTAFGVVEKKDQISQ